MHNFQWRNFVPGCPWVPVAQSGSYPCRIILGTAELTQGCNAQVRVPPKPGCPRVCPPWANMELCHWQLYTQHKFFFTLMSNALNMFQLLVHTCNLYAYFNSCSTLIWILEVNIDPDWSGFVLLCKARPDSGFVKRGGRVPVKRGRVANIAPKPAEFAWFSCQKGGPVPIRPIPGSAPGVRSPNTYNERSMECSSSDT